MMTNHNESLHNPHLDGSPFHLKGGDKAVLLLHGMTSTPHEVRKLGTNLNRAGFSTAGPLLPGHGLAPAALVKTKWQDWYQAAETELKSLLATNSKVFVAGESTGALLALLLAARNPSVTGVLAFSPAYRLLLTTSQRIILPMAALFNAAYPKRDLAGNTTWQGYKVNPVKSVIQLILLQKSVQKELRNVKQPLLVIQGKKDRTIDLKSAQLVFDGAGSQHKEIYWMEKSGHCVLLDSEVYLVNRLVLDFLWKAAALK